MLHVREGTILDTSKNTPVFEVLELAQMASGHLCLNLSERVSWEEFPCFARKFLELIEGEKISVAESVEMRIWNVLIEDTELRLVYDDYPQMVSLEPKCDAGDELVRRLLRVLKEA